MKLIKKCLYLFSILLINFFSTSKAINGLIWSKSKQNFISIFSNKYFAESRELVLQESKEIERHNFLGEEVLFVYYNVILPI